MINEKIIKDETIKKIEQLQKELIRKYENEMQKMLNAKIANFTDNYITASNIVDIINSLEKCDQNLIKLKEKEEQEEEKENGKTEFNA